MTLQTVWWFLDLKSCGAWWACLGTLLCPKPNRTVSKGGNSHSRTILVSPKFASCDFVTGWRWITEETFFLISYHFLACESPWCLVCCGAGLTLWFSSTRNCLTWMLTRFPVIRDQPENIPWFSINIEADRELAGGKINDEVRVPIRWEDTENEINVRGWHKTAASKIATKLLSKVCLSLFFSKSSWFVVFRGSDGVCQEMPSFDLFFCKDCFVFPQKRLGFQWKFKTQNSPDENQDIFFLEYNFSDLWELSCRCFWTPPFFLGKLHPPQHTEMYFLTKGCHMGPPHTDPSWPSVWDWNSLQQLLIPQS